ncbi:MAG TPA: STAS domain-containing protein [Actinomycetota bacterium]|nr:STAS domain-containing protein [Actinomycetota bacterium]
MTGFSIRSEIRGGVATVVMAGELDLVAAPDAERHLAEVETQGVSEVVIDLRPLEFIDSTGLRVVLAADSRARRDGRRLALVPGPEPVHRVFRIALLDRRLEFVGPPEEEVHG